MVPIVPDLHDTEAGAKVNTVPADAIDLLIAKSSSVVNVGIPESEEPRNLGNNKRIRMDPEKQRQTINVLCAKHGIGSKIDLGSIRK